MLLVLPTLVLGGLQWRQLHMEYQAELSDIPRKTEDAARRFREDVGKRLERLIEEEDQRSFAEYADLVCQPTESYTTAPTIPSPLVSRARDGAIILWFAFDTYDGPWASVDMWAGQQTGEHKLRLDNEFAPVTRGLVMRFLGEPSLSQVRRMGESVQTDVPLVEVAVNRFQKRHPDCLQYQNEFMAGHMVTILTSPFHVQFFQDEDGTPRLLASRLVEMAPRPELELKSGCLQRLGNGVFLVQGFFIDPDWLFRQIPNLVARSVLNESQHFISADEIAVSSPSPEYHTFIHLLGDLEIQCDSEQEQRFNPLAIAVDTASISARFRSQDLRFLALAAMLALSLGTGMALMIRSVKSDLERAQRTENFVAAVTHELRTPVSAIKLHGEMLLDGWASDPERQKEYYRRIVAETGRLGTLVERVLEKSRLAGGTTRPSPADLNAAVSALESQLLFYCPPEGTDLAFDLAEDLPPVMLSGESVSSILINLVENARKYAAVDFSSPEAEPILVRTRAGGSHVLLEVLDRGPGIDPDEASNVFEAFYRIGNEATRTSRGTGLGLHLVALQAESIGAEVAVEPRPGGGSIFRIRFETARAPKTEGPSGPRGNGS